MRKVGRAAPWLLLSIVQVQAYGAGVTPYLLTSAQAVLDAEAAGDATVVRNADRDFRCPVQP